MTGAVQGEALIALTAEAAWGIVGTPTGTMGQCWAKHSSLSAEDREEVPGGRGTMLSGLPPDQLFQTYLNLSEASVSPL